MQDTRYEFRMTAAMRQDMKDLNITPDEVREAIEKIIKEREC